jgi:hypothetical protein
MEDSMGNPLKNAWFIVENAISIDDLGRGSPMTLETSKCEKAWGFSSDLVCFLAGTGLTVWENLDFMIWSEK